MCVSYASYPWSQWFDCLPNIHFATLTCNAIYPLFRPSFSL
jgi:hypothetical protein